MPKGKKKETPKKATPTTPPNSATNIESGKGAARASVETITPTKTVKKRLVRKRAITRAKREGLAITKKVTTKRKRYASKSFNRVMISQDSIEQFGYDKNALQGKFKKEVK